MNAFEIAFSVATMSLYLAWGLYTLRLRFQLNEELTVRTEATTFAVVTAFIAYELFSIRVLLDDSPIVYTFTALGLLVSALALYGPIMVSLASRAFVDVFMPVDTEGDDVPQFGSVDALEHLGDFEGAMKECYVMARIFPREPAIATRIADLLCKLDRFDEAGEWFERAISQLSESESVLRLTNRLTDVYTDRLDRKDDAVRVLERFIERFPESPRIETIRARIDRINAKAISRWEPLPTTVLEIPPAESPE